MRISDWSSDVCSSDLALAPAAKMRRGGASVVKARIATATAKQRPLTIPSHPARVAGILRSVSASRSLHDWRSLPPISGANGDRKSGVEGTSVSVRVDLGGRRRIKNKKQQTISIDEYTHN